MLQKWLDRQCAEPAIYGPYLRQADPTIADAAPYVARRRSGEKQLLSQKEGQTGGCLLQVAQLYPE